MFFVMALLVTTAAHSADEEETATAFPVASQPLADQPVADQPATSAPAEASGNPPHRAHKQRRGSTIDDRLKLLTAELQLDANQQAGVKAALEAQRDQIQRLWNDTSMAPAIRVAATQKLSDDTADRIRALLTEEQRKKYVKPRQRQVAVGTLGADVETWMNQSDHK
jgi:hypothetical protein